MNRKKIASPGPSQIARWFGTSARVAVMACATLLGCAAVTDQEGSDNDSHTGAVIGGPLVCIFFPSTCPAGAGCDNPSNTSNGICPPDSAFCQNNPSAWQCGGPPPSGSSTGSAGGSSASGGQGGSGDDASGSTDGGGDSDDSTDSDDSADSGDTGDDSGDYDGGGDTGDDSGDYDGSGDTGDDSGDYDGSGDYDSSGDDGGGDDGGGDYDDY